jgi:hypothetical protein
MPTRAETFHFIERAYEREKDRLPEEFDKGMKAVLSSTPLFGYFPPRWMLDFAATCAFLYSQKGEARLADQAKEALSFYREWLKRLPPDAASKRPEYAEGIGPMEPVFHPVVFISTVQNLRSALSQRELDEYAGMIADTLRPVWRFPEWGGHNRAMLRAAGLASAAWAFPDHSEASNWRHLADELAEESWGRWSIEDAMLYQSHWLRALILYAEACDRVEELKDQVQPRLHMKAMTELLSPLSLLPDFGDSHWVMHSHWEWMACLEWGATAYRDPSMKWAAGQIWEGRKNEIPDAYFATVAMLAWRWADESVAATPPFPGNHALDDLVIKKLAWRTGWEPEAAYACLNYRDEGDYGQVARDYLRTTLAVTAEKMHHGHSDEGSFVMLVHNRTLLLHESGYRESPPDGMYRSPVYHNRLAWQPGRKPDGVDLLPFLRGDGRYQPVRTERLYSTRLGDAEFSRVRVTDEVQGLAWDRSVIFLPELPCWIVLDGVLATRTALRTLASLWWTIDILSAGEAWFETHIRGVGEWQNRRDSALLVCMPPAPEHPGVLTVEPFRRHYQEERALARTWYGEHRAGRFINFITVLWPHPMEDMDESRPQGIEVVESQPLGRGIGIRLRWQGEERIFGTLNDLAVGFGQEDIRPTYTSAQGMTAYGPLSSDAAFAYHRLGPQIEWGGFINGASLSYEGKVLYEGQPHAMFQENRTALPGVPSRFRFGI